MSETGLYDEWTKNNPTNWINTIKNLKNSLFQIFWKIWWKCMNACNLIKKEG